MPSSELRPPAEVPFLPGELWWGGRTADGTKMPFDAASAHRVELHSELQANQGMPLLVSSRGRFLWSDRPFTYEFREGRILLSGSVQPVTLADGHGDLPGAFRAAMREHCPAQGKLPPELFFTAPQLNTWIELNHHQTQQGVLDYARGAVEHGFAPGVLMIDAGWFEYFGHLDFHPGRFPNPRAMMRQLHGWGFEVMLWVSPYFSADSREYRRWRARPGWILRNHDGTPAVLEWWDGHSVHLDLTHPEAVAWLHGELARLQRDYGVAGFKFDAGDTNHFVKHPASWLDAAPADLCESWAAFGLSYPYNELRACWKLAGTPIVQRLHDKHPTWDERGLLSLIPCGIAMGLLGHPFLCPDMVGGGEYSYFLDPERPVDEELFVRWTQAVALFPMIQFSSAPWRVLLPGGLALCKAALELRRSFLPLIMEQAASAARTGEPILRSMEYNFPGLGYAAINDQFLVGDSLLVAPVLRAGARTRTVQIPPGDWRDNSGATIAGPCRVEVAAPLDRIAHWARV